MKQPSEFAIAIAAQQWCAPETSSIIMDEKLAFQFAKTIDELTGKAWLGNATTIELIEELKARAEVHGYGSYKTIEE